MYPRRHKSDVLQDRQIKQATREIVSIAHETNRVIIGIVEGIPEGCGKRISSLLSESSTRQSIAMQKVNAT